MGLDTQGLLSESFFGEREIISGGEAYCYLVREIPTFLEVRDA